MLRETLIITALPNGVVGGRLRVSAFVSPRLGADPGDGAPTLGSYPHLAAWPSAIGAGTFTVELDGVAAPATVVSPPPRPELWAALFAGGGTAPVVPHQSPSHAATKIRSFPVRDIHRFVRERYVATTVASPEAIPDYGALGFYTGDGVFPASGLSLLGFDDQDGYAIKHGEILGSGGIEQSLAHRGVVPLPRPVSDDSPPYNALVQAELFHSRDQIPGAAPHDPAAPLPPMEPPSFDFHSVVAAVGQYPGLLRLLGLVVDLEVDSPLSTGAPTPATVKVGLAGLTPADAVELVVRSTSTRCIAGADGFVLASDDPQMAGGLLDLSDAGATGFDVVDADVDSITLKLLDFGNHLRRSIERRSLDTPGAHALPSVRSAGISVTKRGRALALKGALDRQGGLDASLAADALDAAPLSADDVVRGYRVDVWDDRTHRWHTICARRGTYRLPGLSPLQIDDEGTISIGATKGHPGIEDDLFLHEALFRWTGWSAVAPRPGMPIDKDDANGLSTPDNPPDPSFPLQTSFVPVPGSLPRLRYGTTYRFRVRLVDVAGNSPVLDPAAVDPPGASEPIRYGRFEPVGVPFVLPRRPMTPGESSETLVVRSNFDTGVTGTPSQRHVAPAKVAQLTAEEHGLFDGGAGPRRDQYGRIADHEAGSFATSGALDPNAPAPNETSAGVRYYDTDHLKVPYIPDPLSAGATLRGAPGTPPEGLVMVPFAAPPTSGLGGILGGLLGPILGGPRIPPAAFPNAYSFRLVVAEGTAPPGWDPARRLLTIYLPKAMVVDVHLSSRLDPSGLAALGVWRWLEEELDPGALDALRGPAIEGRLWSLTPYRTLRLVHAVRQPLVPPRFTKPTAVRELGDTFVMLTDTMGVNRPSTAKVEVQAQWDEYVDLPSDPSTPPLDPTVPIPARATPFTLTIPPVVSPVPSPPVETLEVHDRHELHDTKHRIVRYSAVATTRFMESFRETRVVVLTGVAPVTVEPLGFVSGTVIVRSEDGATTRVPGTDHVVDDAAGTIARIAGGAIDEGATVQVSYVRPPVTRASGEIGPPATVDVPSSARPAPPSVRYVVPTFGWAGTRSSAGASSTRAGGGLRVYLDRPWWSSGAGEQLGVVLWRRPAGAIDPPENVAHRVTQLARDPLWVSAASTENPTAEDFPLARTAAFDLSLAENGAIHVDVAPHDVGYDPERGLWYGDIVIDGGRTYWPFVRLALARFQRHSLPDAHLSPVVLADYAQLAPDRAASVSYAAGSATTLNVSVTGVSHAGSLGATRSTDDSWHAHPLGGPTVVRALVQERLAGVAGDLAWVDSAADEEPLAALDNPDGTTTWSGQVTLPAPRGSRPFRLVLREYERYDFDVTGYEAHPAGDPRRQTVAERLVYVDTIDV